MSVWCNGVCMNACMKCYKIQSSCRLRCDDAHQYVAFLPSCTSRMFVPLPHHSAWCWSVPCNHVVTSAQHLLWYLNKIIINIRDKVSFVLIQISGLRFKMESRDLSWDYLAVNISKAALLPLALFFPRQDEVKGPGALQPGLIRPWTRNLGSEGRGVIRWGPHFINSAVNTAKKMGGL